MGHEDAVATKFLELSAQRMRRSSADIAHCCAQLTEAQLWHRAGDYENSVANLLLHLEGNLRQWILHGVAGEPDVRERDAEFSLTPTTTGADALAHLQATIEASCAAILATPLERLLEIIDPQPTGRSRYPTVLEAILQVVSHLREHTGQIILLTKQHTARDLDLSMPRKR